MVRFSRIMLVLVVLVIMAMGLYTTSTAETELGPITQAILERQSLNCAVNDSLEGFGVFSGAGKYEGFDVDTCRAVAAAILGDADAVEFFPTTGSEREDMIQSGGVDIMVRNTTFTISRDVEWRVIFGPTTFYDGQGVGTWSDSGVSTIAELDGTTICVESGTTTELNITDYIDRNGLNIQVAAYPDPIRTWEEFLRGTCESWTADKSAIAAKHIQFPNPDDLIILNEALSKEPLGPLSPDSDPQFAEIVAWTIYGMIDAEEAGISSENIEDLMSSDDPNIQRILGLNNNHSGDYLGINNSFMVDVITQVGNYGEMFERNLAPIGLDRASFNNGVNMLWSEGGILYAPPFR